MAQERRSGAPKYQWARFDLPGYNMPLDWMPPGNPIGIHLFKNALDVSLVVSDNAGRIHTHREVVMLQIMNKITEVPNWHKKVDDDLAIAQWSCEFGVNDKVEREIVPFNNTGGIDDNGIIGESTASNGSHGNGKGPDKLSFELVTIPDVTSETMGWIMRELQERAEIFQETKAFNCFDGVVKSDTAVSLELRQILKGAVHPLEKSPKNPGNHEPGSTCTVNLVDPSLFPLVWGHTTFLPHTLLGLDDCLAAMGKGIVLLPADEDGEVEMNAARTNRLDDFAGMNLDESEPEGDFDERFQHLPCEVSFFGRECRIVSYINNVHPVKHRNVYEVIEKILVRTIPLWNGNLLPPGPQAHRIKLPDLPVTEPHGSGCFPFRRFTDSDHWRWVQSGGEILPGPGEFRGLYSLRTCYDLRTAFCEQGLQVIVKLETVELTPEEPELEQETWHLEGQCNEHICATAVYCYEMENIAEQSFSFRQRVNFHARFRPDHEHAVNWINYLRTIFRDVRGMKPIGTQVLGSVLVPEGRLLTFPNFLQHRRSELSLVDRSKPGHCKTLFLYLVDPHRRIISTANVPPQREDWYAHQQDLDDNLLYSTLPKDNMRHHLAQPISMAEAEKYRRQMLRTRKRLTEKLNVLFENEI